MRQAGLLLHPTSLPGPGPSATLEDIEPLIDFMQRAGLSLWQLLPLNPVGSDRSPYNSHCSFAANEALLAPGWEDQLPQIGDDTLQQFRQQNHYWLRDYALFTLLRRQQQRPWSEWPSALRDRDPEQLQQLEQQHAEEIEQIERQQCLFEQQWQRIRQRCNRQGITLVGDLLRPRQCRRLGPPRAVPARPRWSAERSCRGPPRLLLRHWPALGQPGLPLAPTSA
jgi:4-alpha-glucanotransferase